MSADDEILRFHLFRIARARGGRTPDRLEPEHRQRLVPLAEKAIRIERKVLATPQADAIAIPSERVEELVGEAEREYGGNAAFAVALATNGLDRAAFAAGVLRELRFDAVARQIGTEAPEPSDADVMTFYNRHPGQFRIAERRAIRHILITVNPDFVENARAEAERRIADIAARLRADPDSFEHLARAYSECPTALEGGLVGAVPRGVLYPEVEAAAFALAPGAVGGPVETVLGFHMVRCDAIEGERMASLADAAPRIRDHLIRTARNALRRTWLEGLPRLAL